jgi:hypothetical protein
VSAEVILNLSSPATVEVNPVTSATEIHVATQQVVVALRTGPQGPQGEPGTGVSETAVASTALGGHRVVCFNTDGELEYASNDNAAHVHAVVGLTTGAVSSGDTATVVYQGLITEGSWSWTPQAPVFLGQNGLLTQIAPVAGVSVFRCILGVAVSATQLWISPQTPVVLA